MKFYKLLILILIIFLKTGNVLSENNIFSVNNIEIKKNPKNTNDQLANQAIKKGFSQLIEKILLKEDQKKLADLKFSTIKDLVKYYQVTNIVEKNKTEKRNYFIYFDKDKIHTLFNNRNISYSEVINREIYLLPILKKDRKIYIYNNNFFYKHWNEIYDNDLIEFILPIENIEIIQSVNNNISNLIDLELSDLFEEYINKNLALIIIEDDSEKEKKVFIKVKISNKKIIKNLIIKNIELNKKVQNEKIIEEVKKEIINMIKYQNLIDIRTPSFLNVEFDMNKENNFMELNSRLKEIDLVEDIYVQSFNNEKVLLKIKYLGKLDKIIKQLSDKRIILQFKNEKWSIRLI